MTQQMLAEIDAHFLDTCPQTGIDALSAPVRQAIEAVDRSLFVPHHSVAQAYRDSPLPIGDGQTISQPFIVALMTQLLSIRPSQRVLEIGTGSGYQTAVLAQLASEVFSVEIIDKLASQARHRLQQLGYGRVMVRCSDGYQGWQEKAPFDAILVTAAIEHIPDPLLLQLREGGRMVLPLGKPGGSQQLVVVEKNASDSPALRRVLAVRFVPFTRSH